LYKHAVSDGAFPNRDTRFEGYVMPVHVHHFPLSNTPNLPYIIFVQVQTWGIDETFPTLLQRPFHER
jgi:hypothetical protein